MAAFPVLGNNNGDSHINNNNNKKDYSGLSPFAARPFYVTREGCGRVIIEINAYIRSDHDEPAPPLRSRLCPFGNIPHHYYNL